MACELRDAILKVLAVAYGEIRGEPGVESLRSSRSYEDNGAAAFGEYRQEGGELLVEPRVRDGHRGVVGPCGQGGSHEPLRAFVAGCVAPCGEQPIAEHLRRVEIMRLRIDVDARSFVEHLCE